MPYEKDYAATDVNGMVVDVFGTAISSTISWIDLLILLVVCGLVISVSMGLLFRTSRVLGFG
jgi:hypothetical protein